MPFRELSIQEKALEIAKMAERMADDLGEPEGPAETANIVRAIETAYIALRTHSDASARNVVCALLQLWAPADHLNAAHKRQLFRSQLRLDLDYQRYGTGYVWGEPRDETVDAALAGWTTMSNTDWRATATLLEELGFPRVEPDSLRTAWIRRAKREK